MSRIHDALKKAALSRNDLENASGVSGVEELISANELPAAGETKTGSVPKVQQVSRNGAGRFEELLEKCVKAQWKNDPRMSVFDGSEDHGTGAERFRTLRSRLYQISSVKELRRIVITSSVPAEGKTFVAANLARSITRQPDRRVLLIDADLRASRLHLALGATRTPGLADYLRGDAEECAVIQKGPEENLFFIPAGREVPNPSELLLNERLKKLLDWVTPCFDLIILDTPPALPVHDASIIADKCDGVLFVVLAGSTEHEVVGKAISEFQEKNLLGVVLNGVPTREGYGDYYYGYSYGKAPTHTASAKR